jgi:hypothetical protein
MAQLEKYRGHFLNWYDTRTLAPLTPRYVSTVDSGNLVACLRALGQGCQTLQHQPIWRWKSWEGLLDTLVSSMWLARFIRPRLWRRSRPRWQKYANKSRRARRCRGLGAAVELDRRAWRELNQALMARGSQCQRVER